MIRLRISLQICPQYLRFYRTANSLYKLEKSTIMGLEKIYDYQKIYAIIRNCTFIAVIYNSNNFCMALANLKPALCLTEKAKRHRLEIKIVETRITSNRAFFPQLELLHPPPTGTVSTGPFEGTPPAFNVRTMLSIVSVSLLSISSSGI
jgi:hypothetical protein